MLGGVTVQQKKLQYEEIMVNLGSVTKKKGPGFNMKLRTKDWVQYEPKKEQCVVHSKMKHVDGFNQCKARISASTSVRSNPKVLLPSGLKLKSSRHSQPLLGNPKILLPSGLKLKSS